MSWVLGLSLIATSAHAYKPNIVVIVADDLGWNDVGFHGSSQIPTPNLDALAYNGIILNSHYVQPMCTPSRAALMTGYYPIHTGMQGWPIQAAEPNGLPLRLKLLPQYLKELGYRTHAVGKWHLGYFRKDYTPLYRGFESHIGIYNGFTSYYDYILQEVYDGREYNGFDLRVNGTPAYKLSGRYATDLLTESAVDVITKHNTAEPMFLYLAHIAVHAGNRGKRLEAPQEVVNKFQYITDPHRRTYAAMVSKVDESVGRVVAALQDRGMLSNTIILFLSDNGAPSTDNLQPNINLFANWGSNYPLRGAKETLWEGGVRSASFIWSSELQARNRISNDLIHVTDWLPTLYTAAGGFAYALPPDLDGKDIWNTLRWGAAHPTNQVLLNINLKEPSAAMISNIYPGQETWKIVYGMFRNNSFDGYYNDVASTANPEYSYKAVLTSPAYKSLSKLYPLTRSVPEMAALRREATIKCTGAKLNPVINCNKKPCLFNLARDPCETSDVAKEYTTITATLYNTLRRYRLGLVPQSNKPVNAFSANPALFNNTWSSWL